MKRVLITGSAGMLGSALAKTFQSSNLNFVASSSDLFSEEFSHELLDSEPTTIVHLAGLSFPPQCENDKPLANRVNIEGTQRVCDLALQLKTPAQILLASSAQIYSSKAFASSTPVNEQSELGPQNFYAQTKIEAEKVVQKYCHKSGQTTLVLRLFNHTHKSQDPRFFLPSIYKRLTEGQTAPSTSVKVPVGNLNLERDIGALQDLIALFGKAISWAQTTKPTFEITNVCSGKARNLKDLAELLASHMGVQAEFNLDSSRIRTDEALRILGDCSKAKSLFDWSPKAQTDIDLVKLFLI